MAADTPPVSIVIPTRDYAHFVGDAVRSALAQTYGAVEVIVVDDGSTDHTAAVLGAFGPRIRTLRLDGLGVSAARNAGLEAARGPYVLFLDADDLLLPEAVGMQVDFLWRHPTVDAVYGAWYQVDVRRKRYWLVHSPIAPARVLPRLLYGNIVVTPGVMMLRTAAVRRVGGFDLSLNFAADWDLWLRLARRGIRFGAVRSPVAIYRVHADSMTRNLARASEEIWAVLDRHLAPSAAATKRRRVAAHAYGQMGLYLGKLYLEGKDPEGAVAQLRRALHHDPALRLSVGFYQHICRTVWRSATAGGAEDPVQRMQWITGRLGTAGYDARHLRGIEELGIGLALRLAGHWSEARAHLSAALPHLGLRLLSPAMVGPALRILLPPWVTSGVRYAWRMTHRERAGASVPGLVLQAMEPPHPPSPPSAGVPCQ